MSDQAQQPSPRTWPQAGRLLVGALGAAVFWVWRLTCLKRQHNDPRPRWRAEGRPFAIAILHAHQLSTLFVGDEPNLHAMVSRSADGDFLVPTLAVRGVTAVRGSSRKGKHDKGGRAALSELIDVVDRGYPALLAVDGPRGPRGHVHRGIAELSHRCQIPIAPMVAVCRRRWVLTRAWDRFQLPKPFTRIDVYWGDPIEPAGADVETTRMKVTMALAALESKHDPEQALLDNDNDNFE